MENPIEFSKNIPQNVEHREGPVARAIESQTAKLPSDTFLWFAVGAMITSATLQMLGRREQSNFIGQWAPSLLVLGLYNKLVKVGGSDRMSRTSDLGMSTSIAA